MSDLASPLLVVMRDEAEAFWALAALMERHGPCFAADLAGMSGQLAALRQLVQVRARVGGCRYEPKLNRTKCKRAGRRAWGWFSFPIPRNHGPEPEGWMWAAVCKPG